MDPRQTHGAFSWMEWQGKDTAAARSFYQKVIGWSAVDMPMQDGSLYPGVALGETPIGGFVSKLGLDRQWLPYLTVDDVDERCRLAVEAGATVLAPAFDAPGVGRICIVRDPSQAPIAFIAYPAAP